MNAQFYLIIRLLKCKTMGEMEITGLFQPHIIKVIP